MDELHDGLIFFTPTTSNEVNASMEAAAASKKDDDSFNLDFFYSDDAKISADEKQIEAQLDESKKKRSTTRRSAVVKESTPKQQITDSTAVSYQTTYEEPNNVTRSIILQADELASELKKEFDAIRASKSMKGKYTYLTNITTALASILSTKRAANSDLIKTTSDANNLELKRAKDLKELDESKRNDDARMMDLYSAFINAPMGMYDNKLNMPTMPEMMLGPNDPASGIRGMSMAPASGSSQISPEQLRMRMESDPNIEEVVMYDPASGQRWFEIVDKTTGNTIPNYPRSDAFLLEDISIETRAGIAKNRNLDRVWPLKVVGGANMAEY